MIVWLPVAALTMLVVLTIPAPKTGGQAVLVEVMSIGSAPVEATKLAVFPNELSCDRHLAELENANPLIESRVALTDSRVHYAQALQCFPSKALWNYWRHKHCLDGSAAGECV